MFTLTVTLKGTEHQVVLSFKTLTGLEGAWNILEKAGEEDTVALKDDFGRTSVFGRIDILSFTTEDVAEFWKTKTEMSVIKLRAENDFNDRIKKDPTLSFLVGGARPAFGDR